MQIKDKVVFVSGANRGIGKALVDALLKRGAKKIYAAARDPSKLPAFNDARVVGIKLDITDKAQINAAANEAADTDILINNAGVAAFASALHGEAELAQRDMNTNYFGTMHMMRAFAPKLSGKGQAAIANVASIAAFVNFPMLGGYSASKAALYSLTQAARIELASEGISVHSINPGPIDTDMAKDLDMDKASASDTAEAILDGLEANEADIFPDAAGRQMFDVWNNNYRDLEKMVADMYQSALHEAA